MGASIRIMDAGIIKERYSKVKGITGQTRTGPASSASENEAAGPRFLR